MKALIRKETETDYDEIREVIKSAFTPFVERDSEFNEWTLADKIRESSYYINDLSLVAEADGKIVGHIMYTPVKIKGNGKSFESLDLAPISVHPDFQDQGIGKQLVQTGLEIAKQLGYKSIIVMGHPKYYKSLGFKLASNWKIGIDENFNSQYLFALELVEGGLEGVNGIVEYCPAFYDEEGELL